MAENCATLCEQAADDSALGDVEQKKKRVAYRLLRLTGD